MGKEYKFLRVEKDLHKYLEEMKEEGESFTDVICRLIGLKKEYKWNYGR